ncbi:MAG TPA: FkbM family methyltransferase, partial [Bryobacterales bacterium]|nr:FkbM family methyltransferase [Bryobacterales bacterium]
MLRSVGFDVRRCAPSDRGIDPFYDMQHFLRGVPSPLILDVGANVGQSVDRFKHVFPDSFIHSFEPSPATYTILEQHCNRIGGVKTWNYGVGSSAGALPLLENSESDLSSFLAPGSYCWGEVTRTTNVEVVTLDAFAQAQSLGFIHVLKSDTQGFDFEVLKGAERLMNEDQIGLIYFELIVSDQYERLPPFT